MKYYLLITFLIITALCCKRKSASGEDPFTVAKLYCDCIKSQMVNAQDSSVNLNDCEEKIFSNSRLLTIYADFDNRDKYSHETLDSAFEFSLQVRDIEDSLCYNKIDFKKVKKVPHIKM